MEKEEKAIMKRPIWSKMEALKYYSKAEVTTHLSQFREELSLVAEGLQSTRSFVCRLAKELQASMKEMFLLLAQVGMLIHV